MKKLIMFICLILSLATMILFTISISQLFNTLGLGNVAFDEILMLFQEMTISELAPILGLFLWGIFQLYGVPLVVFLISIIGLTGKQ